MKYNSKKTILITGGTGSFGKSFIKHILKKNEYQKIIIFSRDELKQHEMRQDKNFSDLVHKNLRYFIGDVRDKERLVHALREVDVVVHAAALKQVPTGEYNPSEVIKTNIIGAQNIIDVSLQQKVQKVIALSTDKAVSPINLYGASKLCSDKLFISSNNIKGNRDISFSVVRYGNVMGSRGSVLHEFKKQKINGLLKITHKDMTRFNIFLKESVEMVNWALKNCIGGEILIPKIPSFKITDLAKAVAPNSKIKIIGIRDGEKIHEELLSKADSQNSYDTQKYYLILDNNKKLITFYKNKFKVKKVPLGFSYTSDNNKDFLSVKKLKDIVDNFS